MPMWLRPCRGSQHLTNSSRSTGCEDGRADRRNQSPRASYPGSRSSSSWWPSPSRSFTLQRCSGSPTIGYIARRRESTLFDQTGKPIGGVATTQVKLYDAGTDADEELGVGPSQGLRQPHPRYGPPEAQLGVRLAASDARCITSRRSFQVFSGSMGAQAAPSRGFQQCDGVGQPSLEARRSCRANRVPRALRDWRATKSRLHSYVLLQ